jgi:hypothetical protein
MKSRISVGLILGAALIASAVVFCSELSPPVMKN